MPTTLKQIAGATALTFLRGIVEQKESGGTLPPVLDKIADLAIKGKATGQGLAVEAAKEETKKQFPWILVAVLVLALVIVLYTNSKK